MHDPYLFKRLREQTRNALHDLARVLVERDTQSVRVASERRAAWIDHVREVEVKLEHAQVRERREKAGDVRLRLGRNVVSAAHQQC